MHHVLGVCVPPIYRLSSSVMILVEFPSLLYENGVLISHG